MPEELRETNRFSAPAGLEAWLSELLGQPDGKVKCYGTVSDAPTKQLKNKFGQSAPAAGGLLSFSVMDKSTHDRAAKALCEHWHDPNYSRGVSAVMLSYHDGERWRVGTVVSDPESPYPGLIKERLFDDIEHEVPQQKLDRKDDHLRTPPNPDIAEIHSSFASALKEAGLDFGSHHDELTRTFVSSLAAKRFVILTGLSGSGKTQLGLQFGKWLGAKQFLIVPVRPDWTGPEHLFGYEDALRAPAADGRRPWVVPRVLEFVLQASYDPTSPYLLVLDEMNLAHVERYFADALSGIESGLPVVPNLEQVDGDWFERAGDAFVPFPENLFVVGTVNVDETTFAMSPKVLDRANTIEFRVSTDALPSDLSAVERPGLVSTGAPGLVQGFGVLARDHDFHRAHPPAFAEDFVGSVRRLHAALLPFGFEFGHRTFFEGARLAALLAAAGADEREALDTFALQKVLPRLHGSRRALEPVLRMLEAFARNPQTPVEQPTYESPGEEIEPALRATHAKIQRMKRALQANQFASFWD